MAAWLNEWSAEFAPAATRGCCSRRPSTRSPRRTAYVAEALDRGARVFKVHVQVGRVRPARPAARRRLGAAGGDRHPGGHPLRLGSAGGRAHRAGAGDRAARAVSAAAAGDRAPGHAGVPGVPRPGRALRAGAPGHHDVRHRLHRAADAVRPRRPAPAGRAAGQGAARQRLPVDPVPVRPPARRRCTGWSWGRSGCAPSSGGTAPGCSDWRPDAELHPHRRPSWARRTRAAWPASTSGCSAGRSATTPTNGRPCGRPTGAPGCPSSWRPTTCRRCGRRSRAPSRCSSTWTSWSTTSRRPARSPRRRERELIGGHEDDDEIVRVYRDPAGHPFCLFVRR